MKPLKNKNRQSLHREALLNEIWVDLINGKTRQEVEYKLKTDSYSQKTSDFKKSTIASYIKDAYEMCEVELKQNKDALRALFYERYLSIYEEANRTRQLPSAITALDRLVKMTGLAEPEQQPVSVNQTIKINFPDIDTKDDDD